MKIFNLFNFIYRSKKYIKLSVKSYGINNDYIVVNNIITYSHLDFNKWLVEASADSKVINDIDSIKDFSGPIYIIIETIYHDAFAHWFFESAIWLDKVKNILDSCPNSKLYFQAKKSYKNQILEFYNISLDRVAYSIEPCNLAIFVRPCTSLNDNNEVEYFKDLLSKFSEKFDNFMPNLKKETNFLLMPRQKKENYISNDREVNTFDIELFIKNRSDCLIFNSDLSHLFSHQVKTVKASSKIALIDGSAFLVNGFIANNSLIIVLGDNLVQNQRILYAKKELVCRIIERKNAITYVNSLENIFNKTCIERWL